MRWSVVSTCIVEQLAVDSEPASDTDDDAMTYGGAQRLTFLQSMYFATATFSTTG